MVLIAYLPDYPIERPLVVCGNLEVAQTVDHLFAKVFHCDDFPSGVFVDWRSGDTMTRALYIAARRLCRNTSSHSIM